MFPRSHFQKRCEKVSASLSIAVHFVDDKPVEKLEASEDDGTLHIRHASGLRACFDVSHGQVASGEDQNGNTASVLKALKLGRLIDGTVLVEEACSECETAGFTRCDHDCEHPCDYCEDGYNKPDIQKYKEM